MVTISRLVVLILVLVSVLGMVGFLLSTGVSEVSFVRSQLVDTYKQLSDLRNELIKKERLLLQHKNQQVRPLGAQLEREGIGDQTQSSTVVDKMNKELEDIIPVKTK